MPSQTIPIDVILKGKMISIGIVWSNIGTIVNFFWKHYKVPKKITLGSKRRQTRVSQMFLNQSFMQIMEHASDCNITQGDW